MTVRVKQDGSRAADKIEMDLLRFNELLEGDARARDDLRLPLFIAPEKRGSIFANGGKAARFTEYDFASGIGRGKKALNVLKCSLPRAREQALRDQRPAAAYVFCQGDSKTCGFENTEGGHAYLGIVIVGEGIVEQDHVGVCSIAAGGKFCERGSAPCRQTAPAIYAECSLI